MRSHAVRILSLALAAVALVAGAAGAQGKGHDKGHGKGHDKEAKAERKAERDELRTSNGVIVRDRDAYGNPVYATRKVPPGLAKKPGQMPPGQYRKRYGTSEGADVLGGILRRRGYTVVRTVPAGGSRYVYYRAPNGVVQRAIVSPGTDRLGFTNVPATLLQEVLARLY